VGIQVKKGFQYIVLAFITFGFKVYKKRQNDQAFFCQNSNLGRKKPEKNSLKKCKEAGPKK